MTSNRKSQLLLIGALFFAGAILAYVAFGGIESNLVYYLSAEELLARGSRAEGATVRLGGLVQEGSVDWDAKTLSLSFRVGTTATGEPHIAVASHGAPPQMFQEGIGAIVEGQYRAGVFHAERVLVKHSNEYRPPAEGEKPADVYRTLVAAPDAR